MNYQQLITQTLSQFELTAKDVYSMAINFDARTVTVLTTSFAKYVIPFDSVADADADDYNQDTEPPRGNTPLPTRRKMVKRAS